MWRTADSLRARRVASGASEPAPRCAASSASHGSCSAPSTTSSSGHMTRSASHGSVAGSIPDAAAIASPVSRRGDGKSTFAQTPSARPDDTPSCADSRCVSQRSTPRVGTATTSRANGSPGGAASSAPSASTSASARSARWMCSTASSVHHEADVRVLAVEGEIELAKLIRRALMAEGQLADVVVSGEDAGGLDMDHDPRRGQHGGHRRAEGRGGSAAARACGALRDGA